MGIIDALSKLSNIFLPNDSTKWCKRFYNETLPKIQIEYDKLKNEDGSNFADYMEQMRNEVITDGVKLDSLLPRVFALVKKGMGITLGIEHFDVQLLGGTVLHAGKIAEMSTGEGKTFITPLAAALNSLSGKSIFLITSNDYLAQRDADLLKPLYNILGLSVSYVTNDMGNEQKEQNYKANIIYTSHNAIVFDYLRDRLAQSPQERIQPAYHYAIIDEVDLCLIDAARTPLIISGNAKENTAELYSKIAPIIKSLQPQHYTVLQQNQRAILTEEGFDYIEHELKAAGINENIYLRSNIGVMNAIGNLLHAWTIFQNGRDYIITHDNEVLLIDQYTHRSSTGRRFSHGLHQAIEAIEGVTVREDNIIAASITYFTYIKLFNKVAGMSGTCTQERNEFLDLYDLEIITIPTNRPLIRKDHSYIWLFKTREIMYQEVVHILKNKPKGRPVLICTPSVYESEMLHDVLVTNGIQHRLLNAKHHADEASIIEVAGLPNAVTLTTGMAGRGTDILLGGSFTAEKRNNPDESDEIIREKIARRKQFVIEVGGLEVLTVGLFEYGKTESQIRGRAGRQGEPGETRVFCSRDDPIIRSALPQANAGVIESIAHSINFPDDSNVVCNKDATDAVREIQYVHQANSEQVRRNQAKLSTDAESVKIPGKPGNYHYRDYLMDVDMSQAQLHEALIHKGLSKAKNGIHNIINYLNENVFKNTSNPLAHCTTTDQLYKEIHDRIQKYYESNSAGLIIYTYDKCYEQFMISKDGEARTVNTIVYGQMDPGAEFQRKSYELLQEMMHKFTLQLLHNVYYVPNMHKCSINLDSFITYEPDYTNYFYTHDNPMKLHQEIIRVFFEKMNNNFEEISSYLSSVYKEMGMMSNPFDKCNNVNEILEIFDTMILQAYSESNNILYEIYKYCTQSIKLQTPNEVTDEKVIDYITNTGMSHCNTFMQYALTLPYHVSSNK